MKEKTARILALALLSAAFILNVVAISFCRRTDHLPVRRYALPKFILLAAAFALCILLAYRLSTEKNEPVRIQWVVICACLSR
jgi:FtsH-binding integral membrane protein